MPSANLGIADVRVKLLAYTPHLAKSVKKYNFDISAHNKDLIMNSPFAKPLLAECIESSDGTFAAFFPSRRKWYVSNAMDDGTVTTTPGLIQWTPLSDPPDGIPTDIVDGGEFSTYSTDPPPLTPEADLPADYKGPIWEDNAMSMPAEPNDALSVKGYMDLYGSEAETTTTTTEAEEEVFVDVNAVYQTKNADGLWWAIESDDFLTEENTPFWINVNKMGSPSSSGHETCFIVRIGPEDDENKFDIYLSMDKKPRVVDYLTTAESGLPPQQVEFESDFSRLVTSRKTSNDLEIGIMTIAGRLVVMVNNVPMVYSRINRNEGDDGGQLLECKIPIGKIQIFGTNVETSIMVCPMTFAEISVLAVPLPSIVEGESDDSTEIWYQGCNNHANPEGSVAELPTPPSYPTQLYGVDCNNFSGDGGSCSPEGFAFHQFGDIIFSKASASAYSILPNTDFYTLVMFPDSSTSVAGLPIPNGGCPYFFRLKGLYENTVTSDGADWDISQYLISASETAQAPDYFHVKKSASLTFYNPNGEVSDLVVTNQTVIRVAWGWDVFGLPTHTFTGIVLNVSKSEVAGKETVTLNCEDYMYVLKSVPIINSPFYDGMVAVYAIQDLAERGGALTFEKDWEEEEDYFLPSGYAFSSPKMRFNSSQNLLDCILEMTKRFEAYVYFDAAGKFHINKLPGGLFSAPTSDPVAEFTSDMIAGGPINTILEERTVDISFESTLNAISILTVDRNTRNAIIYAKTAAGAEDHLVFLKPYLYNQPAFGELDAARAWAEEFALRAFFPILTTTFKTTGFLLVNPMEFITVDGQMFRVMSVKRSFTADSNDMNCSYECEWLATGTTT